MIFMTDLKISDILKIGAFPFFVFMLGYSLETGWTAYHNHILWWPNRVVHFLGGLSMAVSGYFILKLIKKWKLINASNRIIDFLIIFLFVSSITVFWEFYEFVSDKYFYTNAQPDVNDVMMDQIMGVLGAISFGIFWRIALLSKKLK
jgi:hypothetical protein